MSDLEEGKYWIQNAAPPKSWIGIIGSDPEKRVVTEGKNNVWTVKRLDNGKYTLSLEEIKPTLFIQDDDGKLVGVETPEPSPSEWIIRQLDPGNSLYTIEVHRALTIKGWTVNEPIDEAPKTPVTVNHLDLNPLQPEQQWNFISWPGPK